MGNEELYELVLSGLRVNDYNYYPNYKGKKLAEHLEKILYICPVCGHMHTISTNKNMIYCSSCKLEVEHLPSLTFKANREEFSFKNVSDWYKWQIEVIKEKDYNYNEVIYQDEVGLYLSQPFKKKELLSFGIMKIYNDRFTFDGYDKEFLFDDIIAVTLVGKKKMNIYVDDTTYQIFNNPKTNLLKYMHLFYVIKNIGGNYEFLGL
jgi:1-acyl-sn-glycerol-3-phosphate acyltransferase